MELLDIRKRLLEEIALLENSGETQEECFDNMVLATRIKNKLEILSTGNYYQKTQLSIDQFFEQNVDFNKKAK